MTAEPPPWSEAEFVARLRARGARYHIHHPFQMLTNEGELDRTQIQGRVANRYYSQISIPLKDAAISPPRGSSTSGAEPERALEILQFKLDRLWSMLDAMQPAWVPTEIAAG